MIETNVEFLEEYKELDNLMKDYLRSESGVTAYIEALESMPSDKQFLYLEDIKKLKHLRWIRNNLAHESNSMNKNVCNDDDIDSIRKYYEKIINNLDPLHILSNEVSSDTNEIFNVLHKSEKPKRKNIEFDEDDEIEDEDNKRSGVGLTLVLILFILIFTLLVIFLLMKI